MSEVEPTMRYRQDAAPGATQSEQNPKYFYKVMEGDDVEDCLTDGWFAHPDDIPKPKEKVKLGPKPKVKEE